MDARPRPGVEDAERSELRSARWFDHAARRAWQLIGVALAIWVVKIAFERFLLLWIALFVGLMTAALLTPVAQWAEDRGLPRSLAAFLVVLGGMLIGAAVLALVVWRFVSETPALVQQLDQLRSQLQQWLQNGPFSLTAQQISSTVDQTLSQLQSQWQQYAGRLLMMTMATVRWIGAFLLAVVLAFFLIRDRQQIAGWIIDRTVDEERREEARAAGLQGWTTLRDYIRGTVLVGLVDAVLIGAALLILGVPLVAPLTALVFLGAFIPVVGATASGALAVGIAGLAQGFTTALIVLAAVIVVQQLEGNVLQPVLMGSAVNLHPIVIMLVLTAGGLLAGLVGAIVAVPITAVIANVGHEIRTFDG